MATIMLTEQGTPIISKDGKFYLLEEQDTVRQRLWNVFNTQVGTHRMFPDYGFDIISIIRADPQDRQRALYVYCIDALNPDHVDGLREVQSIYIEYENDTASIDLVATTDYGNLTNSLEVDFSEF